MNVIPCCPLSRSVGYTSIFIFRYVLYVNYSSFFIIQYATTTWAAEQQQQYAFLIFYYYFPCVISQSLFLKKFLSGCFYIDSFKSCSFPEYYDMCLCVCASERANVIVCHWYYVHVKYTILKHSLRINCVELLGYCIYNHIFRL